jgi:putative PIN family toxin of toxin-antitoxin system
VVSAIIDTNILVSAMLSPRGNEALIVLGVKHGFVRLYFSEEILEEYSIVLARPKFGFPPHEIAALIDMLRGRGKLIQVVTRAGISPDPGDDKFIACALASKADFLVTGNRRDLPDKQIAPTKVVSTSDLLDLLTIEL